jgi:hypothetical protein
LRHTNSNTNRDGTTLRAAGFYAEWKKRYGPEAWAVFEKQVGALS